jgi:DNA-binding MarR family transcriptional regulator/N-acetylglutamate synthase-like GNAT family acetyltransferase
MTEDAVSGIRRFNRFYARRIGLLEEGFLGSRFSYTQARLLHELATGPAPRPALDLREALGLDAGYLSRLLAGFEAEGLIERTPHPGDGRQSLLLLTAAGRAAFAPLDRASAASIAAMLDGLGDAGRRELANAMARIERLMAGDVPGEALLRPHRAGDIGWIIARHAEIYGAEYGFGTDFEAIVTGICATFLTGFDPAAEKCWIAERDGERLGCVFLVRDAPCTARLRLLLVEPSARRLGLGRRLVRECVAEAGRMGYARIVLWTRSVLVAARAIYAAEGFRLIVAVPSDAPGATHREETWALDL